MFFSIATLIGALSFISAAPLFQPRGQPKVCETATPALPIVAAIQNSPISGWFLDIGSNNRPILNASSTGVVYVGSWDGGITFWDDCEESFLNFESKNDDGSSGVIELSFDKREVTKTWVAGPGQDTLGESTTTSTLFAACQESTGEWVISLVTSSAVVDAGGVEPGVVCYFTNLLIQGW